MRLMITGGLGFIGSHLIAAAEAAGHEVVAIVDALTYAGRRRNVDDGHRQFYREDIGQTEVMRLIMRRHRPDAVLHLAAESHVGRSIDCRDEFLRTNVLGTYALLEAALTYWRHDEDRDSRFRFVHVSTDEVYGTLGLDDAPWTEQSPYRPNNPYAASKAASDHMVRAYHRTFGLPTVITHSSNNYGPRQHPEKLIPTLIRQAAAGQRMTLHGDGLHVRDWLHVEDHCAGLLAAAQHGADGGTYNFGGLCERTNLQIAQMVSACIAPGRRPEIELVANRPGNDRRYGTAIDRAAADLRWRPGLPINGRLAATVAWYLDHPDYEDDYGR